MDWRFLFFSFDGRINRAKYWLAIVINMVLPILVLSLIYFAAAGAMGLRSAGSVDAGFASLSATAGYGPLVAAIILTLIIVGVMIYSSFAVAVKRLHDRDKSGWWVLVFYVLPNVIDSGGRASGGSGLLSLIGFAIGIWAFVELGCLRGTVGDNRFGPDPLATA